MESFTPYNVAIRWYDDAKEDPIARDVFAKSQLRKGEMWWAIKLRHALMILEDWSVYYTYKRLCVWWCAPDEQYIPTLLGKSISSSIDNQQSSFYVCS